MNSNNGFPKDWQHVKLREVCEKIIGGGTPSTKVEEYWRGNIPWISSADILGLREIAPRRKISKKAVENSATNVLPKGGIIVVTRVGLGKLAIAPYDICFSQDSQGLILNEKIISQSYALVCLSKAVQKFKSESRGTTISGVTKKQLAELDIPLPPLPTQHRIVSKIEELFSELDKGIENLKTVQQQLKTYRQAVLKWAFEGKLSATDLTTFKKLSNLPASNDNLPKGWKWVKVADVAEVNPKLPNKENISDELEIQFLPMKHVEEVINKINLKETRKFKEVQKKSYTPFVNGDVIFAKVTPCMENGKIAVVNKLKNGIGYGSSEFHVIRVSEEILSDYIFYFVVQERFRKEAENKMTGAVGLRRVPKQFIEQYSIPLPSLEEQHRIVQEIESRLSVCDKTEETITASLQQAEALRQSILKRAFEGRLVEA